MSKSPNLAARPSCLEVKGEATAQRHTCRGPAPNAPPYNHQVGEGLAARPSPKSTKVCKCVAAHMISLGVVHMHGSSWSLFKMTA